MLAKNQVVRLLLFGVPLLALAVVALVLTLGPGAGQPASADAPHAGLNFSVGIDVDNDGDNDCGTGVPMAVGDGAPDPATADVSGTKCTAADGASMTVNVYLMSLGTLPSYDAQASHVLYTGLTSGGRGDAVWTGCVFEAPAPASPGFENVGCAIGLPPAGSQTNLGLMTTFPFTCTASGTVRLGHDLGETALTDDALIEHREAGPDALTVNCGAGPPPPPTDTFTPVGPTDTPGPPTATFTPTSTRPPTATPTPTSTRPPVSLGDVNGDGSITSEDSLWILWDVAGIVESVPLPENADVNDDGVINVIDALFVLWIVGGDIPAP